MQNNSVVILFVIIFLYGIVVGSFLNVCICRIPKNENIITKHSYCPSCKNKLKWYDMIPVLSYIFLKGKCRNCKHDISIQYPLVELLNGILWVMTFVFCGFGFYSICCCFIISILIVISVIDFKTYIIPYGAIKILFIIGVILQALSGRNILQLTLDIASVSGFLAIIYFLTKGKGIGGGDIKLMAASGLVLSWKINLLAFFLGCFFGSVIHLIRMRYSKVSHMLALGPYLSVGIVLSMWFGEQILTWYLSFF